jgi:hypothetical protein
LKQTSDLPPYTFYLHVLNTVLRRICGVLWRMLMRISTSFHPTKIDDPLLSGYTVKYLEL